MQAAIDPIDVAKSHLRPAQKVVLQVLQDLGWEASYGRIAQETKITVRNVNIILRELAAAGVISRIRKGGVAPALYQLHPEKLPRSTPSV